MLAPVGRASESRSLGAGDSRTLSHKTEALGLRACGCRSSLAAEAALRHSDARPGGAALRMAPGSSAGSRLMRWFRTRSWADAVRRGPDGGIRSAAPPGRASESRSPDAGDSRTPPHNTEAPGSRACGRRRSLAAEAALRHSDARPGGAALRMAPGSLGCSRLMRWLQTPFMGRCCKPVSGRRRRDLISRHARRYSDTAL